jgi:hypothetical protein
MDRRFRSLLRGSASLAIALWSAAQGDASAADAPTPVLTVVLCPGEETAPPALAQSLEARLRAVHPRGVDLRLLTDHGACRLPRAEPSPPSDGPDVVITLAGGARSAPGLPQIRVTFRVDGRDVETKIRGRVFVGRFAAKSLFFPVRLGELTARPAGLRAGTAAGAPGDEPSAALAFTEGLLGALAYRKLQAIESPSRETREAAEESRRAAARALSEADVASVATARPVTAAVIKQLRATLLLDAACGAETPSDLLHAAAELVPYSATARTLAGLGRLKEAYDGTCVSGAEHELFAGLALDPWSEDAAGNLGALYELTVDWPRLDATRQVSVAEASRQLQSVWNDSPPKAPWALELGVGADVSSDLDQIAPTTGARVELTLGRDGRGLGARVALDVHGARQTSIDRGWASWTRGRLELGGRYRLPLWRFYGEAAGSLLAAYVLARGHGFEEDLSASSAALGATAGLRMGCRLRSVGLWLGASSSYFFSQDLEGWPRLGLQVEGSNAVAQLPRFELSLVGGLSVFFWL